MEMLGPDDIFAPSLSTTLASQPLYPSRPWCYVQPRFSLITSLPEFRGIVFLWLLHIATVTVSEDDNWNKSQ